MAGILPYSTIRVNSGDCLGSSASFTFVSQTPLFEEWPGHQVKIGLIQAIIPGGFVNVNNSNNYFTWLENQTGQRNFYIPIGTYTATQLATAITTGMNATSTLGITYTCSVNATGYLQFVSNNSPNTRIVANNSAILIGMNPGTTTSQFNNVQTVTLPNQPDLTQYVGPGTMLVHCREVQPRMYDSGSKTMSSILAVIPNDVINQDQDLIYSPVVPKIIGMVSTPMTSLTFRITDANNNDIVGLTDPVEFLLAVY